MANVLASVSGDFTPSRRVKVGTVVGTRTVIGSIYFDDDNDQLAGANGTVSSILGHAQVNEYDVICVIDDGPQPLALNLVAPITAAPKKATKKKRVPAKKKKAATKKAASKKAAAKKKSAPKKAAKKKAAPKKVTNKRTGKKKAAKKNPPKRNKKR